MKNIIPCIIICVVFNAHADNCTTHKKPDLLNIPQKKQTFFNKWDVDKDGKLSKKEFVEMIRVQFEKKKKEDYLKEGEKRFKNKDKNQDGFLTIDEFIRPLKTKKEEQ